MILRRALPLLSAGLITLAGLYVAVLGISATRSGLTWREMDQKRDGRTSISEFLNAADVDQRPVVVAGKPCIELFYLKDGSWAKLVCPAA